MANRIFYPGDVAKNWPENYFPISLPASYSGCRKGGDRRERYFLATFKLGLISALLFPLLGCSLSGPSVPTPYTPIKAAEVVMATYDANQDGKLSGAELDQCHSLKSALPRIDTNRDGAITDTEIVQRLEALAGQSTFVAATVSVSKGGHPVAGATVKLIPEPFMGEGYQSFIGETNADGSVSVEGEESLTPGIPTGFYQVRITESAGGGEAVLGCEVSDDLHNRLAFSLDS